MNWSWLASLWLQAQPLSKYIAVALRYAGLTLCWINTRPLGERAEQTSALPDGMVVGLASPEQCLLAAQDHQLQLTAAFVNAAFAQRAMCHAVWHQGQMVSYAWRVQGQAPHSNTIQVTIPPGFSYGYNAFTLPDYRGQGLYPAIARAELHTCLDQGLTQGISFTEWQNMSSMRADRKFGNRVIGLAGIVALGPLTFTFATAAVKALGFQFQKEGSST